MNESLTTTPSQGHSVGALTGGVPQFDLPALFELAIKEGKVDVIERMMAVRAQIKAEQAAENFVRDLAAFQQECPIIAKPGSVLNKDQRSVRYTFAPLDYIITQVRDLVAAHGFSYNFDTKTDKGDITVRCIVTHRDGHSKESAFTIPTTVHSATGMSPQQGHASALSYAKRYAFQNAFGIQTGDEDDDANTTHEDNSARARLARRKAMAQTAPMDAEPIVHRGPEEGDPQRGPLTTQVAPTIDSELQDLLTSISDCADGEGLTVLFNEVKGMEVGPRKEVAQAAIVSKRDALGLRWDKTQKAYVNAA